MLINMIVILGFLLLLIGCSENNKSYLELVQSGDKYYAKKRYRVAGDIYFNAWCKFPDQNAESLFKAIRAYAFGGQLHKMLALADDYTILTDNQLYEIKATAYYNQVKSPLKNIDQAKKALYYLNQCPHNNNVEHMKKYIQQVVEYAQLIAIITAVQHKSLIYALDQLNKLEFKFYKSEQAQLKKQLIDNIN